MDIKDASQDSLETELGKRIKNSDPLPIPLESPDFTEIKGLIVKLTKDIGNGQEDEDFKHLVFETAANAVYGKTYWNWYNKRN